MFTDSVRPVIDAGFVEPVESDTALTRDVHRKMTPGHTPGHLSVWVGHRCVITGDVLRHPIRCRHPEWRARGDADPDAVRATRRALLAAAATTNALVLGTHFTGTAAGRILSSDQGYRVTPQP